LDIVSISSSFCGGYNPVKCVFIFATPRYWKGKDAWIKVKKKEGVWRDVIVYDSSSFEQWLDLNIPVARWFSVKIGKYPNVYEGVLLPEEFWKEWSIDPISRKDLCPEIVTAGRENETQNIINVLQSPPTIIAIRASTKNEAVAFIIASALQFSDELNDIFLSKSVIVNNEVNFRSIYNNSKKTPLCLIPTFEEYQILYAAVSDGHHVIVPLGADDSFNQTTINLPTLDRDIQISSLIKSGYSREDAERFSRESGRNITILKKLLGFPSSNAKWLEKENIREIIPVLLIGRWNENHKGDIELIETVSGMSYKKYKGILCKWRDLEESPILQIGETWRLTSPMDIWTTLGSYLTKSDIENIETVFNSAYKNGNPEFQPETDDKFLSLFTKEKKYSKWIREGIIQSLILISRIGESVRIPELSKPQNWVDGLIGGLLYDANNEIWISVDNEMPLIAEASPASFLRSVQNSLTKEEPEILALFSEGRSFGFPTSKHTGLLWALEGLAWIPEYLYDASLILLILARLDPGGKLANRPINSLYEIFKPWHYQTLAPFEERMEILHQITKKEPKIGWKLLIGLLPGYRDISQNTHKMRWRIFDENLEIRYTSNEAFKTHSKILEILFQLFNNDEVQFSDLLDQTIFLKPDDRIKVLDWALKICGNIIQKSYVSWNTIRNILGRHRTHKEADWALPEEDLDKYQQNYDKLMPMDVINQQIWLFNDHWPELADGFVSEDYKLRQKELDDKRIVACKIFIESIGLEETLKLSDKVQELWIYGDALGNVIESIDEMVDVFKLLVGDVQKIRFLHSIIFRKSITNGFDYIKSVYSRLVEEKFSSKEISHLFIPQNQSGELWDFLSHCDTVIQSEYWSQMFPRFYNVSIEETIYGIEKLVEFKRFFSAMKICFHSKDKIPTNILINVLRRGASEEASENFTIGGYEIEDLFNNLEKREDITSDVLTKLEWLYLPILGSYGSNRNPVALHKELAAKPEFFIEILCWIYKPKNVEEERKDLPEDFIQNRAHHAYLLLKSWDIIPGMTEDNSINKNKLFDWVKKSRKLAEEADRSEFADIHIGKVLAKYPENPPHWPQEIIFELLEEINSDVILNNYASGHFNKRGVTSRGVYDGGKIERRRAAYFDKLAKDFKYKFPNVSGLFKNMSLDYLNRAEREDLEAERDKLEY